MSSEQLFNATLQELQYKITGKEINAQTIMVILRIAMEMVETTQLKGTEQKILVERLVRQVVLGASLDEITEKLLLDMFDKGVIGQTIDFIILATKGEININIAKVVVSTCWPTCLKLGESITK